MMKDLLSLMSSLFSRFFFLGTYTCFAWCLGVVLLRVSNMFLIDELSCCFVVFLWFFFFPQILKQITIDAVLQKLLFLKRKRRERDSVPTVFLLSDNKVCFCLGDVEKTQLFTAGSAAAIVTVQKLSYSCNQWKMSLIQGQKYWTSGS